MTTTSEQPTEVHDNLDLVYDVLEGISSSSIALGTRAVEEAAVVEFVAALGESEERRLAIQALATHIRTPNDDLEKLKEELANHDREKRFNAQALIETSVAELPAAAERLLQGKNPALVVRANQYVNFDTDVLRPLLLVGSYTLLKEEIFPHPSNGLGHSRVHLDNFVDNRPGFTDTRKSNFPFGLTASRTDNGSVLFEAALATSAVRGWSEKQYHKAHTTLNNSPRVTGLRDRATERQNPHGVEYREWEQINKGVKGTMIATTLNPGDVVVWPQGGEGSIIPAWHGFTQIGHPDHPNFVSRKSISFHLGKLPHSP